MHAPEDAFAGAPASGADARRLAGDSRQRLAELFADLAERERLQRRLAECQREEARVARLAAACAARAQSQRELASRLQSPRGSTGGPAAGGSPVGFRALLGQGPEPTQAERAALALELETEAWRAEEQAVASEAGMIDERLLGLEDMERRSAAAVALRAELEAARAPVLALAEREGRLRDALRELREVEAAGTSAERGLILVLEACGLRRESEVTPFAWRNLGGAPGELGEPGEPRAEDLKLYLLRTQMQIGAFARELDDAAAAREHRLRTRLVRELAPRVFRGLARGTGAAARLRSGRRRALGLYLRVRRLLEQAAEERARVERDLAAARTAS